MDGSPPVSKKTVQTFLLLMSHPYKAKAAMTAATKSPKMPVWTLSAALAYDETFGVAALPEAAPLDAGDAPPVTVADDPLAETVALEEPLPVWLAELELDLDPEAEEVELAEPALEVPLTDLVELADEAWQLRS